MLQLSAALRPTGGGFRHKIFDKKPVALESDSQEKRRNRVAGAAENRYFCKYNEHQYAALMTKAEIVKQIAGQTGLESKMVAGVASREEGPRHLAQHDRPCAGAYRPGVQAFEGVRRVS